MSIDTTSLRNLISEMRLLQAKDSITPESLGYILDRMVTAVEELDNKPVPIPVIPTFLYDSQKRTLFITTK